jgi:hypothetical protein
MRVFLGALASLLLGALVGAGFGLLVNPRPVAVPNPELAFVNYIGPIIGAAVGGTLGFIFGGGWLLSRAGRRSDES